MDNNNVIKKKLYFTEEEYALVRVQAKRHRMKPTRYIKEKALDPSGDSVLKRHIVTTMSRFYEASESPEYAGTHNMFKEVAERLWQYLE